MPLGHWDTTKDAFLLDVREKVELAVEHVPDAVNIPSASSAPASTSSPVTARSTSCADPGSARTHATRILLQNGFDAWTVSGGMLSHAILAAT